MDQLLRYSRPCTAQAGGIAEDLKEEQGMMFQGLPLICDGIKTFFANKALPNCYICYT